MYSLEQLKIFVTVADTGSFSACARQLNKAQSAISQAIANLELDLDNELFDRRPRKPQLTPQGEQLLSYAKAVLHQSQELKLAAEALQGCVQTELVIAVDEALIMPALEGILSDFSSKYPTIALEINAIASPDVIAAVTDGRAHLGLMFADMDFPDSVDLCFLGNLPFYAVISPDHPLSRVDNITISDLIPHRQLMLKGGDGRGLAQFNSLSPRTWSGNNFFLLRELVRQGLGWCYIPCHLVEQEIDNGNLYRLPLSFDHQPWSVPVERVLPKNAVMSDALQWLSHQIQHLF
ncbi:DNA-binding transcriptional LysR family regulator [Sinobacterium caligoides]|uniref:DNA-binding transcriptional LysR family regulator n=1 Tax=Sinobacterium caligoides TaxID=933926 RepID=A0A3N2DK15_9GAMM|nr:LysR family transcriptional regulator [Sinobacterium caligoides]ROS00126.1 DNA-binding transcriptional LysR family regulator [Sinobacterium caligoides]